MRLTCSFKKSRFRTAQPVFVGSRVVINSSKNTCRMSIIKEGRLFAYTSVKRSDVYTGYERRLWIAAYTTALHFAREARRNKEIRKTRFLLCVKGSQKHALAGFLDSGFVFTKVIELANPAFNGCRSKKKRRL